MTEFHTDRLATGITIMTSHQLPLAPGDGEQARRIVRHGLADVLTWLGQPIGLKPDELVHSFLGMDPATSCQPILFVSSEYYGRLRAETAKERITNMESP